MNVAISHAEIQRHRSTIKVQSKTQFRKKDTSVSGNLR
jgi:hypothetical protein